MTDSTDNARGPERIWVSETENGERYWQEEHYDAATAFIRADLAPDPQDARVAALVDAVRHEREMVCQDFDMQLAASQAVDAALAAFDKGGKDE